MGALSNALGRLQASRPLRELRETVKGVTKQLPEAIQEATSKIDEYARGMISGSGSTLFEELGLYYIGPIDGHNLDNLLAVLKGKVPHPLIMKCTMKWAPSYSPAVMLHICNPGVCPSAAQFPLSSWETARKANHPSHAYHKGFHFTPFVVSASLKLCGVTFILLLPWRSTLQTVKQPSFFGLYVSLDRPS